MKYAISPVLALILGFLSAPLGAQEDADKLSLARIFSSREFSAQGMTPIRFRDDDASFTRLETNARGQRSLVAYSLPSLRREVIAGPQDLIDAEKKSLAIEDYAWSEDGAKLLLYSNSKRVWRDNTRGDYHVFDLKSRTLSAIGDSAEASRLMFAKFDPKGEKVGYVYRNDIYVQDLKTKTITPLTDDGSTTTINGTSDWVYEEELALRDCFKFSPDGDRVAYWQFDAEGVGEFLMIDNLAGPYAQTIPVQYPKVGDTNSSVRVGVVATQGGDTTWMKVPGDPRQHLIARMDWSPDSSFLVIQQLDRIQSQNRVWIGDPRSGDCRLLFVENDEAWVDVAEGDLTWRADGEHFFWTSERDGWRHLWSVSAKTAKATLLTPGDWDVLEIAALDDDGGRLYVIASPQDATRRSLHVVNLENGERRRLTPPSLAGWNEYQVSPGGAWALHTRSTFDRPPRIELVSLPGHATLRTFVDNAPLNAKLSTLERGQREFMKVEIEEGVSLDGWMMKPADFDAEKKYPVLVYVYGEPWSQTVVDRFQHSRYLWHLFLTQQGYVVLSFDNRGTPGPKGRAWRKHVHRSIGIKAPVDQARALEKTLAKHDFLDSDRVGIWGWSGGGSMSLHMIFKYPKLYRMAMSVAPVTDLKLYDTIYEERYMDLPTDNPEGYRDGSPLNFASRLEGDLLVVHGTHDDNVHYQHIDRLVDALVAANKTFEMMAYPNRSHGIYERPNTRRHLFETLTSFLRRKLPAGPRRRQ
jgi:dipeptidyl-peptidase 4